MADSTIQFDREVKVPLDAENNVIEVWLVDINEECLEVYWQPIGSGYKQVQKLERCEKFFTKVWLAGIWFTKSSNLNL